MRVSTVQLRARLDRELRSAISDLEWELLVGEGYVDDWENGGEPAYEHVEQFIRRVRRSQRPTAALTTQPPAGALEASTRDASSTERSALFARSVSENVTAIASDDDEV